MATGEGVDNVLEFCRDGVAVAGRHAFGVVAGLRQDRLGGARWVEGEG